MQIYNDHIRLDVRSSRDLRELPKEYFEEKVNSVIQRGLEVKKETYDRNSVPEDVDISMVPRGVKRIRVISIGDFDSQPCINPHVDNTCQVGAYVIDEIIRIGKDTYRFRGGVRGSKVFDLVEEKRR
jgi:Ser-tRNA(Ala) deacylase AlaX